MNTKTTTTQKVIALRDDKVGDIQYHGQYGGSFVTHWRIDAISNDRPRMATITRVVTRSFLNPDGTYGHEWVPALPTD
jgi:hypothetical protein